MLQCIVVTPERTLYDRPADFVALTLFDGEIGIAPGHTPLIGRLGCGECASATKGERTISTWKAGSSKCWATS